MNIGNWRYAHFILSIESSYIIVETIIVGMFHGRVLLT